MRSSLTKWIPLFLSILLLPTACGDDGVTGPGDGQATLSVYLTDAPGDVEAVWVELLGLTAKGGEGGSMDLLTEPTDLILLTDLVGAVQLLSINSELDPTTISQLRMIIGDAVLLSSEGIAYIKGDPVLPEGLVADDFGDLQCPSCSQSGLKVKVPNDEMEVGEGSTALVLDFDVALSFGHKAGNSGKWVMHPVIHATLVGDQDGDGEILDDLGLVNSVTGTVALGTEVTIPECPEGAPRTIEDFIPTVTLNGFSDGDGQPIVRSGSVAGDGTFQVGYLPSGSYAMGYVGAIDLTTHLLTFTASVAPTEVTVSGADVSGVAFTIENAVCGPVG